MTLRTDVHAVLFPAFAPLELDSSVLAFLEGGGKAILLGETRDEYVSRKMSDARRAAEDAAQFKAIARQAVEITGPVLIGVDQELAGIQRLEALVPALPSLAEAQAMSAPEIEEAAKASAMAARELGVNLFLSPIVDVVTGLNPWLQGRTLGNDVDEVSRIASAFIRGVQSAGVAATAKHFPGHAVTVDDPALLPAVVPASAEEIYRLAAPFRAVINSGVQVVMTGPALIPALDPTFAASTSSSIVAALRTEFGFEGLIMSDDLDAPGILRGNTLIDTAIASLRAGVDLLLLAAGPHLPDVVDGIMAAVERGDLATDRVKAAAAKVRRLAEDLA